MFFFIVIYNVVVVLLVCCFCCCWLNFSCAEPLVHIYSLVRGEQQTNSRFVHIMFLMNEYLVVVSWFFALRLAIQCFFFIVVVIKLSKIFAREAEVEAHINMLNVCMCVRCCSKTSINVMVLTTTTFTAFHPLLFIVITRSLFCLQFFFYRNNYMSELMWVNAYHDFWIWNRSF